MLTHKIILGLTLAWDSLGRFIDEELKEYHILSRK